MRTEVIQRPGEPGCVLMTTTNTGLIKPAEEVVGRGRWMPSKQTL